MSVPCWTPKEHRYDGTCNNTRLVLPHYETMPDYIRVYDVAIRKLPRGERNQWRKARNSALKRWGYPWVVKEIRWGMTESPYKAQGITLSIQPDAPLLSSNNYGGFGLDNPWEPWKSEFSQRAWDLGKGYVAMHPNTVWNALNTNVSGKLIGVMCHEFGHALGFGHGGEGIMRSSVSPPYYPDDDELFHLKEYWGEA